MAKWTTQISPVLNPPATPEPIQPPEGRPEWTKGTCPNCDYADADIDAEGVLWCPACGYSKKGCYT